MNFTVSCSLAWSDTMLRKG